MLDKLIELIKTLKMSTICEGVETKENVEYLTKIGCDSIQGYYYSKPIPWEDFKKKYGIDYSTWTNTKETRLRYNLILNS